MPLTPILIFYFLLVAMMILLIIMENRNPTKTVSWILVLLFLPFLGLILYLFFGQNYRRKRIISHRRFKKIEKKSIKELPQALPTELRKHFGNVPSLLNRSCGAFFYQNNQVDILEGGGMTYAKLFEALEQAKKHIHIEYYIINDDAIGQKLQEILIRKSQEGVKVRLIYDDVGSWKLSKRYLALFREYSIECYPFFEVRFPYFTSKINCRNHRKIVIVDGIIGFTGGVNIAERYQNGPATGGHWRDLHLMIEGDAVNGLQATFLADWYFVSSQNLSSEQYFPRHETRGTVSIQVATSGPDSPWESIMQAFMMLINNAQEYVYITTPYLMPTESLLMALKSSALSGVDVRIIIPEQSDAFITQASSHSYIRELLDAGIRVYHYTEGFLHSKLVLSEQIASVGTANFDFRSFEENFEVTTFIYDATVISQLKSIFLTDIKNSKEILLPEWKRRSLWKKVKESFARLFSPLL